MAAEHVLDDRETQADAAIFASPAPVDSKKPLG